MECLACRHSILTSLLRPISISKTSFSWNRLPASSRLLTTRRKPSSESRPRRSSTSERPRPRLSSGRETSGRPRTFAPRPRTGEQRGARPPGPARSSSRRLEDGEIIGTLPINKHDRSQKVTRPVEEQGLDSRGKKHRHATKRSARSQRRSALSDAYNAKSQPRSDSFTHSSTNFSSSQPQSKEPWAIQKAALKTKLQGEAWNPRRRLSPTTIEGIRAMHANNPAQFTTAVLAEEFDVSAEEIRRILKSKWKPSAEEAEDRNARWERRGERIWNAMKEERGFKVPKPWRDRGVGREPRGRDSNIPFEGAPAMRRDVRRETRSRDSNVPFERAAGGEGRERRPSPRSVGKSTGIPSKDSISETIASALAMSKSAGGNGKGTFAGKIL